MPIVFEQPDAIGTAAGQQAAIGYGTAVQGDKDRQFYLQATALANQARNASAQHSAVNAQIGQGWTQAGTQQAAAGQQADQFAQQQMDAQNRQNAQLQQAEQMQANVFSYQDSLRLQQQQQAWSGVDADPDLSPEEKQRAKAQIAPGMNYLQFKQQKAQQQLQQLQLKQAVDEGQHQAALTSANEATRAAEVDKRMVTVTDLDGTKHKAYLDHKGDLQPVSALDKTQKPEPYQSIFGGGGKSGSSSSTGGGGADDATSDLKEVTSSLLKSSVDGDGKFLPDKYAADLPKVVQAHLDLKAQLKKAHNLDQASQFAGSALMNPDGITKFGPGEKKDYYHSIDLITQQPMPTDPASQDKQAAIYAQAYPDASKAPPQVQERGRALAAAKLARNKPSDTEIQNMARNLPMGMGNMLLPAAEQAQAQQQAQVYTPADQQKQAEWYPAYQKYVSEHGKKTPGEFTVYGHGLSRPQKYRVNEDGSVQRIRQPTLFEEMGATIPSGFKKLGELMKGPEDNEQY